MKIAFQSIRWRLQIWYGLILVVVLTGFGFTAYHLDRSTRFRRVDGELQRRVTMMAGVLRPPNGPNGGRRMPMDERFDEPPPFEGGGRSERPGFERRGREEPPFDRPPPRDLGPPPDEAGGDGSRRPPPRIEILPNQAALFDGDEPSPYYYMIWLRSGVLAQHSSSAPSDSPMPVRGESGATLPIRARGQFREVLIFTPPGDCILVGRSMASELAELNRLAWYLTAVGAGVLLLGVAGGGWLASRAIRPIEDISSTAVKIAGGDLSQRISIAETETELGRLGNVLNSTFARLEASFSHQARFTSDAAHELRTPVSVILTQTQTALARERTAVEFRKTVEACQRAAQRMRRLIESLLELARLDAGQESLKRVRFDLAEIVLECVDLVRPLADERKVRVHCNLPVMECDGDPERIAQVITNILTNAIHYNENDGHVRLGMREEKGLAVLTIADTGQGIPADHLPHIFDRFYRVDASRSSSTGRTGLGLAISKAIVIAHGGSIEASSELRVGTTITVRLPLASIASAPVPETACTQE